MKIRNHEWNQALQNSDGGAVCTRKGLLALVLVALLALAVSGCGVTGATSGQLTTLSSSVHFGNVSIGTLGTQALTLLNKGTDSLVISQANVTGAGFSTPGLKLPMILLAGQSKTLKVQYTPSSPGNAAGSLTLVNNSHNPSLVIPLDATATSGPSPQISLNPGSLDFGNVAVGSRSSQTVVLSNSGNANLIISRAEVTGAGFGLSWVAPRLTLAPNQHTVLTVTYTPAAAGLAVGSVSLAGNVSSTANAVPLLANGVQPGLTVNPAFVSEGEVDLGGSSSQTVTISNTGSAALTVTQVNVTGPGFSVSGLSLPLTLSPSQSTNFSVRFSPTAAGTVTGVMVLVSNAGNPTTVGLSGIGVVNNPAISVSPTNVAFSNVNVGSSGTQTISVTNTGKGTLTVSQANVNGAGFSTSGLSLPLSLQPNHSASFSVRFSPTAAGNVTGSMSLVSNAPNSPTAISLSGNGVATAPGISVNPSSVAFGSVNVGGSASQNATVSNTGNSSLTIAQANVNGAGFSTSGLSVPLTLNPGQNASFSVRFSPTAAGNVTGSISLVSNAPNSPATISLSGSGVATAPGISVNPSSLPFGDVIVGGNASQNVTVSNTGNSSLTITQANVNGAAFSTTGLSVPLTLNPSQNASFSVRFRPTAAGNATGSVSLVSNAPNSPTAIALSGNGIATAPALSVNPTSVAFGSVNVGGSASQSVALTNTGNASLSITQANVTGAGFSTTGISLPLTLTAGQSSNFSVRFAPAAAGNVTGSISIVSNASGSPATISLSGNGVTPPPPPSGGAVPSFPGAQGGGAGSVGGRGGIVCEVTTLGDSGSGSFRDCLTRSGPRTVVFRVAGNISLTSGGIRVTNPYVTIAGQTAPGGGVTIDGRAISENVLFFYTHDVIMRYIRVRKGYNSSSSAGSQRGAGIYISNGSYNVIVDHCSVSWTQDESINPWTNELLVPGSPATHNVTVSYTISSEGLRGHSTGLLIGAAPGAGFSQQMSDIDAHHTLFQTFNHRLPLVQGIANYRHVNNITYNWAYYASEVLGATRSDFINNIYKLGNQGLCCGKTHEIELSENGSENFGNPSAYVVGNIGPNNSDAAADNWPSMVIRVTGENGGEVGSAPTSWRRSTPQTGLQFPIIADLTNNLEGIVLPTAGASRRLDCNGNWVMNRDQVDSRLVTQYQNNTAPSQQPATEADVGGFPTIDPGTACVDSDHDGIPDAWEIAHGLNPNDPSDAQKDSGNGYTWLERYLNGPDGTTAFNASSKASTWAATYPVSDPTSQGDWSLNWDLTRKKSRKSLLAPLAEGFLTVRGDSALRLGGRIRLLGGSAWNWRSLAGPPISSLSRGSS
ncbi:MAG: choice-of-anchor D domain-containing protein [Acidobacteria bacterium]|nr:choice-of-anchor D domain-containing protein [Acidobacteriota bacterium]